MINTLSSFALVDLVRKPLQRKSMMGTNARKMVGRATQFVLLLLFAEIAHATAILDQQNAPPGSFPQLTVANDRSQIQTFTVGVDGSLTQIDVSVSKNGDTVADLVLSIWSTDSAGLPSVKLAESSLPASAIVNCCIQPPYVAFNLDTALSVFDGELLAIVLDTKAPNGSTRYEWQYGGAYGDGVAYTRIGSVVFNAGLQVTDRPNEDFHFKTFVEPQIQFARFTPIAKIDLRPAPGKDWFQMLAPFKLGAASDGIAPLTEAVTIQIGTFSTTIPAGSFTLKNRLFTFAGVIDGVKLHALLIPLKGKTYAFWTYTNSATLTGTRNPVRVGLTIGDDGGSATIPAEFGARPK